MAEQVYNIDENPQSYLAWQCVCETQASIFLTGKAGTGKTTFLHNLRSRCPKRMVVVAPTGVAAINAGGVTIHSFFQLPFSPYIPGTKMKSDFSMRKEKIKIIRTLDLLVIDEISMVRADLLDSLDAVLRQYRRSQLPFGGVQLLMIGDLQQLSPVVTDSDRDLLYAHYDNPYFFSSKSLSKIKYVTIELEKIYRQRDNYFVEILNRVRNNSIDAPTLEALNSRYIADFDPSNDEGYIRLTTHNNKADSVNNSKLALLKGKEYKYVCEVEGVFPETSYPADKELRLKVGAQVMFLKNDTQSEKRYYNGKIGRVKSLASGYVTVECDGQDIDVSAEKWSNTKYEIDKTTNEISEIEEGSFMQIPLRLAWAITIHKSQGLTFDKAIIDAQMSFSHGQVYVALSRCRTLEGLVLGSRLAYGSFVSDNSVSAFIDDQRSRAVTTESVEDMKTEYALALITELFTFASITAECHKIIRILEEHLHRAYPKLIKSLKDKMTIINNDIVAVGNRFCSVCESKCKMGEDIREDKTLKERIVKGADYYVGKLLSYVGAFVDETDIAIDNEEIKKRYDSYRDTLESEYYIKKRLFEQIGDKGFSVESYLKIKAEVIIESEGAKKKTGSKVKKVLEHIKSGEVEHAELFNRLRKWAIAYAKEHDIDKSYKVLTIKSLNGISNYMPTTLAELKGIEGIGKKKLADFGETIIEIVKEYVEELERRFE